MVELGTITEVDLQEVLGSGLPDAAAAPEDLVEKARVLDNFYIPVRYPNSPP